MAEPYGVVARFNFESFTSSDVMIIYKLADTTCVLEINGVQTSYKSYEEAEKALFDYQDLKDEVGEYVCVNCLWICNDEKEDGLCPQCGHKLYLNVMEVTENGDEDSFREENKDLHNEIEDWYWQF